jgi:uncharacterized membrane protein HdeD (DUF308 family)
MLMIKSKMNRGKRMKVRSLTALILGIILFILGIVILVSSGSAGGVIPVLIGGALSYLGWRGGRIALIVFGHTCIVLGCFLITWGIYLLPYSKPTLSHIFTRPLFWGLFSLMGGICANYHGFCQCIRRQR